MRTFKLKSIVQFLIFTGATALLGVITPLNAENSTLSNTKKELTELQEILFKPEKSQLAILLSVNAQSEFKLDSINLYIDTVKTESYLYTDRESNALLENAMQRIHVADLSEGVHTVKAQISAIANNKQTYKISSSAKFTKSDSAKFIELKISKSEQQDLPVLNIKIWE